ncbi:uncharacterized protein LOC106758449 [Vigna radiata var. radiata]|uniref:Uncharacterized protein LOC106758449 n=1 Tax=Vigna radiata var. radiata TaxID=3916 RepID=A0A1S3TSY4_VIGRR|nr:uncharacterized protein LOC106758449 [Vigna radiata var. radiata]
MEVFEKAQVVRLRSRHDKYLLADNDKEAVYQDRNGIYKNAKWSVEIVQGTNWIRLKSCYEKYLTASNMPFLLGATGKKVIQTLPTRLNSSLDWEPVREGAYVRLKTRYGQFLRANKGLPPWKNSITHDIPHRSSTTNWILWDVDLVQLRPQQPPKPISLPPPVLESPSHSPPDDDSFSIYLKSPSNQGEDFLEAASPIKDGRIVFYNVENGDASNSNESEEKFFSFQGSSVEDLKEKLKEETGHDDIVVCCRNPFNAELHPLRLQLPPNNSDMHVVVITPSCNA